MLCLALFCLIDRANAQEQNSDNYKWIISFNFGLQEFDKRMFDFPEPDRFWSLNPEIFGVHQFGLSLVRKIHTSNKINLYTGIGISSELNTFTRPINHGAFSDIVDAIFLSTDHYRKTLLELPLKSQLDLNKNFALSLDFLFQFDF